jgi:hypothetical protein
MRADNTESGAIWLENAALREAAIGSVTHQIDKNLFELSFIHFHLDGCRM